MIQKPFIILIIVPLLVLGCQQEEQTPPPTTELVQLPQSTALSTQTPSPIEITVPTPTSTSTPRLTSTSRPTFTPSATPTPTYTSTLFPTPSNIGATIQAEDATWQIVGCYRFQPDLRNYEEEGYLSSFYTRNIIHIISGQYMFMHYFGNIYVLEIINPAAPKIVYVFDYEIAISQVKIIDNRAFIIPRRPTPDEEETKLHYPLIVDISNPVDFKIVQTFTNNVDLRILAVTESFIYLADINTTHVYTNSVPPSLVTTYKGKRAWLEIEDIQFWNNFLQLPIDNRAYSFSSDEINVWALSDSTMPEQINSISVEGYGGSNFFGSHLAIEGDYLYLSDIVFRILDISDRDNPILIAAPDRFQDNSYTCEHESAIYDLIAADRYVYILTNNYITVLNRIG